MSEFRSILNINPNMANLTVAVSIPSPEKDSVIFSKSIGDAEKSYIAKTNKALSIQDKISFDRARAVCKWGESCEAILLKQWIQQGRLNFIFGFSSLEQLLDFNNNAATNISGSTMTEEFFTEDNSHKMRVSMITHPDFNSLTTIVSTPFPKGKMIISTDDINIAEMNFIEKRDKATNNEEKSCFDRARAICKWASTCGASLISQRIQDGQLHLSFRFPSLEQLNDFEVNVSFNVKHAAMPEEMQVTRNRKRNNKSRK